MKCFVPLFGLIVLACNPARESVPPASDATAVEEHCFLGITSQPMIIVGRDTLPGTTDSVVAHLRIEDDHVTGELDRIPREKDRMTGTLEGTIDRGVITAIYSYTAEGMTAKEEKIMRIDAQGLHLKSGELEDREGIWTLKDTAAPYSETVPTIPCR